MKIFAILLMQLIATMLFGGLMGVAFEPPISYLLALGGGVAIGLVGACFIVEEY